MISVKKLRMRFRTIKPRAFWKRAQLCSAISARINHQTIDQNSKRYQYVSNSFSTGTESGLPRRLFNNKSGNGTRSIRNTKYLSVCRFKLKRQMRYRLSHTSLIPLKVLKLVLLKENKNDWKLSELISFYSKVQRHKTSLRLRCFKTTLMVNRKKCLKKISRRMNKLCLT